MMKKGDIYWITLIIIEIMFIVALVWFATHSLYVTHEEFIAALGIIITGISGGFWALWSKISELTREIGYIRGKLNEKKKIVSFRKRFLWGSAPTTPQAL